MRKWLSQWLASFLTKRIATTSAQTVNFDLLKDTLQPGDVLLVEGDTRVSVAIKYLTQSTWSHAALYVGNRIPEFSGQVSGEHMLIEADLEEGIRAVPLSFYRNLHTRICRPVGLDRDALAEVVRYAINRLGQQYDMRNVFDLLRYLLPTPPVPTRFRRRMLVLGSGDPTRAICSTLIAQAFQQVHYPILPDIELLPSDDPNCVACKKEIYHIRAHFLFVPRDFDASPYFQIIKPTLEAGFDYRTIPWAPASQRPPLIAG
ncbi:YiiX/YebB-like N1pC/P60 family cysteine hydrolase [Marinobacter sp. X15-166B]|uniref:YiiX/YebB-like N1pC/P60 family cysteine hydrolase n=1 Tax=Marinobacter sp. X15-166B TaxID=1897620 RepID=UPI000AD25F10|nr:YiiX/YebB-like N1pC/P60 family cysteine hydrolase [Marinobacter sp. X15-166B]